MLRSLPFRARALIDTGRLSKGTAHKPALLVPREGESSKRKCSVSSKNERKGGVGRGKRKERKEKKEAKEGRKERKKPKGMGIKPGFLLSRLSGAFPPSFLGRRRSEGSLKRIRSLEKTRRAGKVQRAKTRRKRRRKTAKRKW